MDSYISRYQGGEYQQVWHELLDLGEGIREPPIYRDALAVARDTMRRVRHNIETLIPRLARAGYQFGYEHLPIESGFASRQPRVFRPAEPNIAGVLAKFEAEIGVLPLSLYAWYETIGEVNFVGRAPDSWKPIRFATDVYLRYAGEEPWALPVDALSFYNEHTELLQSTITWLDPLQVISVREQFDLHADWEHEKDFVGADRESLSGEETDAPASKFASFCVEVSPDAPLKFGQDGLGAYEVAVPNLCADAPLLNEWHRMTFVDYLRTCLTWAGFPGLELYHNPPKELNTLTTGLFPF